MTSVNDSPHEDRGPVLAGRPPDSCHEFLVARMGVDHRRDRASVSGEPLRQEEILRGAIDVGYCGVPQRVEPVQAIETRACLPLTEENLDPPW